MRTLWLITVVMGGAAWAAAQSDVPASLKPPGNEKLVLQAHATGAQIYTCTAGADGKFSWTLKAPDAQLRDAGGKMIITHSAGPKWQHNDGSSVTGKPVAKEAAPDGKSVAWLLLAADNSQSGAGVLSKVNYVQRIHTEGGRPPATGCDEAHKDAVTRSNYSADYLFYAPGS